MVPPAAFGKDFDPVALLERVDGVADRFEACWASGQAPSIRDYLGDTVGEERLALVRELARIDLERRVRCGERRRWEDYLQEFPELGAVPNDAADRDGSLLTTVAAGTLVKTPWPSIPGYEILAELGQGGMGNVYQARQLALKRLVALKVLRSALTDARTLARFRTEAEAAARLQNPNIVQIYEVCLGNGTPYLALEYVAGGSLANRLAGKPQPPEQAAELVETLARAMEYAHRCGVVHRDLKPANILLTTETQRHTENTQEKKEEDFSSLRLCASVVSSSPKIADFGLAKVLERDTGHTLPGAIVGTPSYMAPEQAEGNAMQAGPLVDVYALGAILYEMLTGRPPFRGASVLDTLEQVRTAEPVAPSRLVPNLPRDLETICLKALARSAAGRYAGAGALADDLHRFRLREPILARPIGSLERLWRWGRRQPARAGLALALTCLLVTVVVASMLLALASRARERDQHRQTLIQRLHLLHATTPVNGWSDEDVSLLRAAANLRQDEPLRTLAAASCAGLDARAVQHLEKASVSWIACDRKGKRLLLGGRQNGHGQSLEGAKLWELDSGELLVSEQAGAGPVAFRTDGRPIHLAAGTDGPLLAWDLLQQKALGICRFDGATSRAPGPVLARGALGLPVLALDPSGKLAAAGAITIDSKAILAVWQIPCVRLQFQVEQQAASLAFTAAGDMLAAAAPEGPICLWSVPSGNRIAVLNARPARIHCLAFSPQGRRLAVGDAAGTVTVWDVDARLPVSHCYGGEHDVHALTFSPDGTLLASAGSGPAALWDAATGRCLLRLQTTGLVTAVAFTPNGQRLILGSKTPAHVSVWELDAGREIQTLRGLTGKAANLVFDRTGGLLAAFTAEGHVALWDLRTGGLRHLLRAPGAGRPEDVALAFNPDGRQLAAGTVDGARLWDTDTGMELSTWRLPHGVRSRLAFHPDGPLLLFRAEGSSPNVTGQGTEPEGVQHVPLVCRLRNLLGTAPGQPLAEVTGFDRHFLEAVATPDGRSFVAEGVGTGPEGVQRTVRAYDALTGVEQWSLRSTYSPLNGTLALDPSGRVFTLRMDNRAGRGDAVDVASGTVIGPAEPFSIRLGAGAGDTVHLDTYAEPGDQRGIALFRAGEQAPCVRLGMESTASIRPAFCREGALVAWSNADGTVSVCDLGRVRRRFADLGLEW
jgi:serine/threonine protein kinase/WD40 repeat protein